MPRYDPSYCPYCGAELVSDGGPGGYCGACDEVIFQQPVTAVETLVVEGDALLLQKRAAGRRPGTWGFPGGHLDPGESPWVAAAGELAEETGLSVEPSALTPFDTVFDANEDGSEYVVLGYAVRRSATEGTPEPDGTETEAVAFCRPGELPDESGLFHPKYRQRMERAVDATGAVADLPAPATLDLRE